MKRKLTHLQRVENERRQAQPAVQTVHVGYFGCVVEVKDRHHGYDSEHKGQHV